MNPRTLLLLLAATTAAATTASASGLPNLGTAPAFAGRAWLNTDRPLDWPSLRGKVVVLHFWTLGCINCKHNLPIYNRWEKNFKGDNFEIVGIHTPELDFERQPAELKRAIQKWDIRYPVLSDNSGENWNRWHQQYWPAVYLVDKQGRVRDSWSGELNYDNQHGEEKLTAEIRELLKE